jgi:hypothetical protein
MAWTFCTSGAAIWKAGEKADATATASGAWLAKLSDEAENYLCALTRNDLITNWSSLTAKGKEILQKYCSAYVAQNIINYNMSGYTSRNEAIMMLNVLENQQSECKKELKESKVKEYLAID